MKTWGILLLLPALAMADNVVLSWQPNTEADLAGYQVYYGTLSNAYSVVLDVGMVTQQTVQNLLQGTTYYFAVTAYDASGNESDYSAEVSYRVDDTTPPAIVSAACEQGDRVKVVFSEYVEKASAEVASNYRVNNGITVQRAELQSDLKTVYVYTTQHASGSYTLYISNVRDRAAVPISIAANSPAGYNWIGGDVTAPSLLSAELIRRDFLAVTFSEPLNQASALALANYAISPAVQVLGSGIDGAFTKVYLTTASHTPGVQYTLTVNNVRDASSPGNVVAANTKSLYTCTSGDADPPRPVAVRMSGSTQVQVEFSEPLETASAQSPANYSIAPSVSVLGASLDAAKTTVTLTTNAHAAASYTLTVRNVRDAAVPANAMPSALSLPYTYAPPDVTPPAIASVVLTGNDLLQVSFTEPVERATAERTASYAIDPSVRVLAVTLNVTQETALIQTDPHAAGGYTLRVSGVRDLAASPNTIAANASRAYTYAPADVTPPAVLAVTLHGANLLEVVFSEPLDRASAETASRYVISPSVAVTGATLVGDRLDRVYLATAAHTPGQSYALTVSGIRDKATVANVMPAPVRINYNYPAVDTAPPRIVSAALTGGNQFLELGFSEPLEQTGAETAANYNLSNGIAVERATLDASGTKVFLKTATHTPGLNYTVTVRNVRDLSSPGNVIGSDNQKAYACAAQDVLPPTLVRAELLGNQLLELVFNEPLDPATATVKSRYAITNNITVLDAKLSATQTQVWLQTSVHARGSFSVTASGLKDLAATPNTMAAPAQAAYSYQPADTAAPRLLLSQAINETMIELTFSEPLDPTSAKDITHYTVSNGVVVERAFLDDSMTKVILQTSRQLPGSYQVTINGLKDASSNNNPIATSTLGQYAFASIDRTPPAVQDVDLAGETMVVLSFSESLNPASAVNKANYAISGNVQVKSAYLTSYDSQVVLETSAHAAGDYTLTLTGIQDASVQKNPIVQYTQVKYTWSPVDTVAPALERAQLHQNNQLELVFSEPLEAVEAKKAENYTIVPAVPVFTAVLDESLQKVWLYTGPHAKGSYTVTASKVTDRALKPNALGPKRQALYACLPPDTTGPALVSVNLRTPMSLLVTFDEPVTRESTENPLNYTIEPAVEIKQASLLASLNTVNLETAPHQAGVSYVIRIRAVRDRTPIENEMKRTATAEYRYTSPDSSRPVLLDGKLRHPNLLELVFSEPLEAATAENRDNYRIDPSVEVLAASLDTSTLKRVYLETTTHFPGVGYGINVRNVRDRAPIPNTVLASTWWSYSLPNTGPMADKTPPALARVDAVSATQIDLVFTEPLDRATAENRANYAIGDSVSVTAVKVDSDLVKVHLTTTPHRMGRAYRLTVRNIGDRAAKPNMLAASPAVPYLLTRGLAISNPSRTGYGLAQFSAHGRSHADRDYTVVESPDYLAGAGQVLTANADKTSAEDAFLSFELRGAATVYVAVDKRLASAPAWLADWKATGDQVTDSRQNAYALYSKRTLGGRFTLGGNHGGPDDNMYLVFAVPNLTNGMLLAKVSRSAYQVSEVEAGDAYYIDRDYTVASMPDSMSGSLWIRTANDDKVNRDAKFLTFELSAASDVMVGYDARIASLPKWLSGWEALEGQIVDSRGQRFDLLKKSFTPGEVSLGGNCGSPDDNMYVVLVRPLDPDGHDNGYTDLPGYFTLSQNYPNPFNPETTIEYQAHKAGRLRIAVFNVMGQRVRVLVDGEFHAGARATAVWDAKDDHGEPVASGVYFYRIEQDRFAKVRRMLLVR